MGQPIDLKALRQSVCALFPAQHPSEKVALSRVLPSEVMKIHGVETMLREALLNVLTNAVIHGGAKLSTIQLHLSRHGQNAVLTVTDDGKGIPPDRHVEAISRFSQAGGGPGSGLGLPIASKVMQNHGGQLEILDCRSGASIRLSIPLVPAPISD